MNKYQEPLENIIVYPLKEVCENSPCCQCENQCDFYKVKLHDYNVLQELVDRATPKKPRYEADGYCNGVLVYDTWRCPNCETRYEVDYDEFKYCPKCGQAIDWSDKDAK